MSRSREDLEAIRCKPDVFVATPYFARRNVARLPCHPAAETALQPLIRCSESLCSHMSPPLEECFFTDTGAATIEEAHRQLSARLARMDFGTDG